MLTERHFWHNLIPEIDTLPHLRCNQVYETHESHYFIVCFMSTPLTRHVMSPTYYVTLLRFLNHPFSFCKCNCSALKTLAHSLLERSLTEQGLSFSFDKNVLNHLFVCLLSLKTVWIVSIFMTRYPNTGNTWLKIPHSSRASHHETTNLLFF